MVETDYVDITPNNIDPLGMGKKKTMFVFQELEWKQIRENPGRLTKEGVQKKIKLWAGSQNKHVAAKYKTMLAQCEKLEASGKTTDGRTVYSRSKKGVPNWVEEDKPTLNVHEEEKPKPKKVKKD